MPTIIDLYVSTYTRHTGAVHKLHNAILASQLGLGEVDILIGAIRG